MAFQDFDLIQERRRNVRAQQLKRRITIAVVSFIVILLLAAAAVCAVVYKNHLDEKNTATKRENKTPPSPASKASPEKQPPPKPVPEKKQAPAAPAPKEKEAPAPAPEIVQTPAPAPLADNAVKALCALTDYPDVCATSLSKALTANAAASGPKELVKASINATNDGLDQALSTAILLLWLVKLLLRMDQPASNDGFWLKGRC